MVINGGDNAPVRAGTGMSRCWINGFLLIEVMVAVGIICIAMIPMALTFAKIQKSMRQSYQRAVAIELVDGEMEILLAGEWREFREGTQEYMLRGNSTTNLPGGKTQLTIEGNHVRLAWQPARHGVGGDIVRDGIGK